MTMDQIIAIIATGVLCVLCVVWIASAVSNKKQIAANSKAIKDIEKSLSSFGDSIKVQTDKLIDHLEQQPSVEIQDRRLELLEEEIRLLSSYKEAEQKKPEVSLELASEQEVDEIEELDDEIELDDLLRELNEAAAKKEEPAPPELEMAEMGEG